MPTRVNVINALAITLINVINALITDTSKSSLCGNRIYLFMRQDQKVSFLSAEEFNPDSPIAV